MYSTVTGKEGKYVVNVMLRIGSSGKFCFSSATQCNVAIHCSTLAESRGKFVVLLSSPSKPDPNRICVYISRTCFPCR